MRVVMKYLQLDSSFESRYQRSTWSPEDSSLSQILLSTLLRVAANPAIVMHIKIPTQNASVSVVNRDLRGLKAYVTFF